MIKLYAPKEFWELPSDQRQGRCGAGKGLAEKLVPEKILFLSVTPACSIHDYMFAVGETLEDFNEANRVFHNNMYRLIEEGKWYLKFWRRRIADGYFEAVQSPIGSMLYWKGKNKPENLGAKEEA